MHLLYLDDSGSVGNPADRHIVLAGVSVFERQAQRIAKDLDAIAEACYPEAPHELEFRGSSILGGRKAWRRIGGSRAGREQIYVDALGVLAKSPHVVLWGAAIHKVAISPQDPMEYAFEQLCNRFDRYLGRLHRRGDTQRGLIVLDKSSYETSLQSLANEFRVDGHRWGQLYNIAEVPLFVDSRATRMIQFADLVAYAIRQYHEHGMSRYVDIVRDRFDSEGGTIHGLVHYTPVGSGCACYSCRLRAAR